MRPRARSAPAKPAPPPRRPSGPWKLRTLLIAAVLAAYLNSFGLGFALDGNRIVSQDQRIREATAQNFRLILDKPYYWPSQGEALFRPAATFSFLFNYSILGNGGNRAEGYHSLNFLLHLLNTLLLFALARRLFRCDLPAFFAAALWAVHPIDTEAVANVAGRPDLLAAAAVLGGLLLYVRAADSSGWRRKAAQGGLFAIALAGICSQESAAILAGAMLAWDVCFAEKDRASYLRRLPFYAAALIPIALWWLWKRQIFSGEPIFPPNVVDNPLLGLNFWASRWMALKVLALDLWLMLFPMSLSADRSYNEIPFHGLADPLAWLAAAALAAIAAALFVKCRHDRVALWPAAFCAIALLPTANLIVPIGSIQAERFLYLPAAGFTAAIVALLWKWKPERTIVIALSIVLALFIVRTLVRNRQWNDNASLAAADVQSAPRSARLHDMYGQSLYAQDPQHNLDRAIGELETAWSILRPLPPAWQFAPTPAVLGTYYGIKGDLAGAGTPEGRAWYEKARVTLVAARDATAALQDAFDDLQRRQGRPVPPFIEYAPAYFYLGQVYQRLGNYPEALRDYRQGADLEPGNPTGYDAIGKALYDSGDFDAAAVAVVTKVLLVGVDDPNVSNGMQEVYGKIPDAACAFPPDSGGVLNLQCPRVHADLCKASVALAGAFLADRQPDKARESQVRAASQYGCPFPEAK